MGFETEFIAHTNLYATIDLHEFQFLLTYQQEPRANAQFEVFERAPGGDVILATYFTDAEGIGVVTVQAGHEYLLNAVVLREPSASVVSTTGAVWETLWASMTFSVPDQ